MLWLNMLQTMGMTSGMKPEQCDPAFTQVMQVGEIRKLHCLKVIMSEASR